MGGLAGKAAVAQCLGSLQQLSVLAATWSLPTHSLGASVTQEPHQAFTGLTGQAAATAGTAAIAPLLAHSKDCHQLPAVLTVY